MSVRLSRHVRFPLPLLFSRSLCFVACVAVGGLYVASSVSTSTHTVIVPDFRHTQETEAKRSERCLLVIVILTLALTLALPTLLSKPLAPRPYSGLPPSLLAAAPTARQVCARVVCECMYVCVCVYVSVCMCMWCMYVYVSVCMCMCVYV